MVYEEEATERPDQEETEEDIWGPMQSPISLAVRLPVYFSWVPGWLCLAIPIGLTTEYTWISQVPCTVRGTLQLSGARVASLLTCRRATFEHDAAGYTQSKK